MATAQILVFLSQKPSAEDEQFRGSEISLGMQAWGVLCLKIHGGLLIIDWCAGVHTHSAFAIYRPLVLRGKRCRKGAARLAVEGGARLLSALEIRVVQRSEGGFDLGWIYFARQYFLPTVQKGYRH